MGKDRPLQGGGGECKGRDEVERERMFLEVSQWVKIGKYSDFGVGEIFYQKSNCL